MTDRRLFRLATTSARLLAGTVVAAVFATAVVTAVAVPWPTAARAPLSVVVDPAPAETVVVCAGPLLVLGADPERADALSVAAAQEVVFGAPVAGAIPAESTLTADSVAESDGVAVFSVQPEGRAASEVAASGSAAVIGDELVGFAASGCQAPLLQSWIVGGSTTTGASDLLLLGNPGDVPATVELTVYGATGAQVPPGGSELVVAAGAQRIVALAGLILGEQSPVVRITATGAPVHAALQSSVTRTLVPGGVDQAAAVVGAATTQVIPGVTVTAEARAGDAADPTSVLRLLSPDVDTTASVTVVDDEGSTVSSLAIPLGAALPSEVELGGIPAGAYSVRVDAPAPVVAAVWQATGLGEEADFAWYAAAPALSADAVVAVPDGPDPTLWAFNAGDEAVTVAVESLFDGDAVELSIPAGQASSLPLTSAELYRLRPSDPVVHAMVSFAGDGALAAIPVWPESSAAATVVVYP